MSSSVLLGKRLRRQIRSKVWPMLAEEGFVEFAPLRAYRDREGVVDVVEFSTFRPEWNAPRWLGGEAYANGATFTVSVGTYFLDVDKLPWATPRASRPKAGDCHRCTRLAHETTHSTCDGRTFHPGAQGERLDEVVEEAMRVLRSRGLGYLDGYRDREGWLADHDKGSARHPGAQETVELNADELADMVRRVREGRGTRSEKLEALHDRLHLVDEHLTDASPCGDVLAALLMRQGRVEDAIKCLDAAKREQLRQLAA